MDPTWPAWRALACEILLLAFRDVRRGNGHSADARSFLDSDGARWLVTSLDIDEGALRSALAALPAPTWSQMELPFREARPASQRRHGRDPIARAPAS